MAKSKAGPARGQGPGDRGGPGAQGRSGSRTGLGDEDVLDKLAHSVRGTFQTVEDMTQSFIREAILQGLFPPGQRLNLDSIAAQLGVSRMPVRASLRQLEGEGLVRIHPHRGVTVSVLQPDEVAEIYELRILLESYLLERAMPHLTDEVLQDLRSTAEAMEGADNLADGLELRKQFYERLYSLANRPRALAEAKHLRGSVGRYLLLLRVAEEHGGHPSLLAHLEAGDLDAGKQWLSHHLTQVSTELQKMVGQSTPDPA